MELCNYHKAIATGAFEFQSRVYSCLFVFLKHAAWQPDEIVQPYCRNQWQPAYFHHGIDTHYWLHTMWRRGQMIRSDRCYSCRYPMDRNHQVALRTEQKNQCRTVMGGKKVKWQSKVIHVYRDDTGKVDLGWINVLLINELNMIKYDIHALICEPFNMSKWIISPRSNTSYPPVMRHSIIVWLYFV